MSEILKTEAVVLSKIDYGDSSNIVSFFTKDFGKLSAIIKGARNPKSKIGPIADPMNYVQLVIYSKESRDLQIASSIDLISHFPKIKEDYELLKYAYSVVELMKKLTVEHELNVRLFKGLVRILELLNASKQEPIVIFGRFFVFFLTELGFQLQLTECAGCGGSNLTGNDLSYNYEIGILCKDCKRTHLESFSINAELFSYLICLKNNETIDRKINYATKEKAIVFMEKYLIHHVPDFKGIQSLQLFK